MKKVLQGLTAANQILLFGVLLFVVVDFFASRFERQRYNIPEPEIRVISERSELQGIPEIDRNYQIEYRSSIADAHVFEVKRSFLASPELQSKNVSPALRMFDMSPVREQTVNVLIVHGENEITKVFQHDVLITDVELPRVWSRDEIDLDKIRCVYSVIRSDTNGDGVLSPKDRISLYSSNGRGNDLKVVVDSIDKYVTIDQGLKTKAVVTKTDENVKTFWLYDLSDETLTEIRLNRSPNQAGAPTP